jgi:putative methionine-R-sulfoxide reductase with GAF domain
MRGKSGVEEQVNRTAKVYNTKFHTVFNALNVAVLICEMNHEGMPGKILEINDTACALMKYSRDEIRELEFFDISVKTQDRPGLSRIKSFIETGSLDFDLLLIKKDGTPLPVDISLRRIDFDDNKAALLLIQETKVVNKSDNDIRRINRLYLTLNHINLAIMKTREQEELFQAVCLAAYEYGHFKLAWIGMFDDSTATVRLVARAGNNDLFLQQLSGKAQNINRDRGPTWTAIRDRKLFICKDIDNDPQKMPWREAALADGLRSMASIPIFGGEKVIAVLNIYSDEIDFITREEQQILQEIRLGLSLAVDLITCQHLRRKAEMSLLQFSRSHREPVK